ncbi:MAG: hypothetical protein AB8E15_03080 [Bdellovibrionales bacterium]
MNFFFVIKPEFMPLAKAELNEKIKLVSEVYSLDMPQLKRSRAGFELETDLKFIELLQFYLRIPSKILLRVKTFNARDPGRLFQRLKTISWKDYLKNADYSLRVSTRASALNFSKKVEAVAKEAIETYFKDSPAKKWKDSFKHEVNINIFEDEVTVSIDMGGEPLYKRGYKEKHLAALREDFASAMLQQADFQKYDSIFDPMAGSGTFLLEAHYFYRPNVHREYAIRSLPHFSVTSLKKLVPLKEIKQKYLGNDISKAHSKLLTDTFEKHGLTASEVFNEDISSWDFSITNQSLLLLSNVPYNHRIKSDFYSSYKKKYAPFFAKFSNSRLLVADDEANKCVELRKSPSLIDFSNNGTKVRLLSI